MKPFCGISDNLVQPSGLCFDDQGNLYVTCMTKRVCCLTPVGESQATRWRTCVSHPSTRRALVKRDPVAFLLALGLLLPAMGLLGPLGNVGKCSCARNAATACIHQSQFIVRAGSPKHCVLMDQFVQIVQYSGPLADNPGQLMRVAAQWTDPENDSWPHDVKWHKGINGIGAQAEPLLLVVRQHGQWQSRLAIFSAVSGQLLKELSLAHHGFSMKYILVD